VPLVKLLQLAQRNYCIKNGQNLIYISFNNKMIPGNIRFVNFKKYNIFAFRCSFWIIPQNTCFIKLKKKRFFIKKWSEPHSVIDSIKVQDIFEFWNIFLLEMLALRK